MKKLLIILVSTTVLVLIYFTYVLNSQNKKYKINEASLRAEVIKLQYKIETLQSELEHKDEQINNLISENHELGKGTDWLLNEANFGNVRILGYKTVELNGGTNNAISKLVDIIIDLQGSMCYQCREKAKRDILYKY